MAEGDIITSGRIENDQNAAIVHLENMKYDKDYPILIEGKEYFMKLSNSDHLWIWKK